jgi:hypothetical protein
LVEILQIRRKQQQLAISTSSSNPSTTSLRSFAGARDNTISSINSNQYHNKVQKTTNAAGKSHVRSNKERDLLIVKVAALLVLPYFACGWLW